MRMNSFVQKTSVWITLMMSLALCQLAQAQIIGPSVVEAKFAFTAEFQSQKSEDSDSLAHNHSQHVFGIFQSPEFVQRFGLSHDLVGGIGAIRDVSVRIYKESDVGQNIIRIKYRAQGKIILHERVAKKLLKKQNLAIPLPIDLDKIFLKKCTDPHYQTPGDYWYFWNPFQSGCEKLLSPEMTAEVNLEISPASQADQAATPRLDLMRGDNGNGKLFRIDLIYGYNEANTPEDEGRMNYESMDVYFEEAGFDRIESVTKTKQKSKIYSKQITLPNGSTMDVEVRHILVDTAIEAKSKAFAKYFKDSVFDADVIIYSGHSGLGGNLDIAALSEKAGEFVFNEKKRQIFMFESCSSYTYYLSPFRSEKKKNKIDIITNGLASYFHTNVDVTTAFLDHLIFPQQDDVSWMKILTDMESPLNGGSYLINVGGF